MTDKGGNKMASNTRKKLIAYCWLVHMLDEIAESLLHKKLFIIKSLTMNTKLLCELPLCRTSTKPEWSIQRIETDKAR